MIIKTRRVMVKAYDLDDEYDDMTLYHGLSEAFMGVIYRYNEGPMAVYDKGKVLEILGEDMDEDDAIEYFDFNIMGLWAGDTTPVFFEPVKIVGDIEDAPEWHRLHEPE
jgi:hypothetical protein